MDKISNAQIAEVLSDASATLRAQQAHISDLEEKLASKERRDRVEKLASEMHRKGLELDTDVETLADRLEKTASAGKLDAVEQAVDMVGPDMGAKIGRASHNPNHDDAGDSSGSANDLERFIVGDVG
jgi:soluble cytochrome b562